MTLGNDFENEVFYFDNDDLDCDASEGTEPVDFMIALPNETRDDRKKRLDLICRNVMDGKIDKNNLIIFDLIAVTLRLQEILDDTQQMVSQAELKVQAQTKQLQQMQTEIERLEIQLKEEDE